MNTKDIVCPQCSNSKAFTQIDISGYVANFQTKPSVVVTGVSHYENVGIFCAVCFDQGKLIQVGNRSDFLPARMIEEKLFQQSKKKIRLIT